MLQSAQGSQLREKIMKVFICLVISVGLTGLTACTTGSAKESAKVGFSMTRIKDKPGFCIIRTSSGEVFEADCLNNKMMDEIRKNKVRGSAQKG
jgi:hypothetical protein